MKLSLNLVQFSWLSLALLLALIAWSFAFFLSNRVSLIMLAAPLVLAIVGACVVIRQFQLVNWAQHTVDQVSRKFGVVEPGPPRRGTYGAPTPSALARAINESLHHRIEVIDGFDRVCLAAAELIEEAHREKKDVDRFVTFYGSASLSTVDPSRRRFGERRIESEDEDQLTPEQVYSGALEAAASDQIQMRRYINLLDEPTALNKRSIRVKREYYEWLRSQLNQLKRNPNYRLINAVRAPTWGSGIACLITRRKLLEITGSGEAALLMVGEELASSIRRHARESVLGGSETINPAVIFSISRPWHQFSGEWRSAEAFDSSILKTASSSLAEYAREFEG